MLAEFEGRTIDAIGGAERGRQHQADEKGRAATVLQKIVETTIAPYLNGTRSERVLASGLGYSLQKTPSP